MKHMELRRLQHEMDKTSEEMAKELGLSIRGYYYRLSGEFPVKPLEAKHINQMVAAHRMALSKRKTS